MNRFSAPLICCFAILLLNGCTTHYDIVTVNGRVTTAKGKPKLVTSVQIPNEAGKKQKVKVEPFYQFTDVEGQKRTIGAGRVIRIHPASDRSDSDMYYIPHDYSTPESWEKSKPWYKRL